MRERSSYKDAVPTSKLAGPGSLSTRWPCRPLITKEAWRSLEGLFQTEEEASSSGVS